MFMWQIHLDNIGSLEPKKVYSAIFQTFLGSDRSKKYLKGGGMGLLATTIFERRINPYL